MKTYTNELRRIWYDPYLRVWTMQEVDAEDIQVGEVDYTTDRKWAFAWLAYEDPRATAQ